MLKNKLLKLCVVGMVFGSMSFAEIHQVSKVEEISRYTQELLPSDLALFDIDMVLIQPSEPAFQIANIYEHKKKIKEIMAELEDFEKDLFINLMVTSVDSILVDDQMPSIVRALKEKKVKSIALTAGLTGALDNISNMEEWKCGRLKQCGFDFSESFSNHDGMVLTELPTYRGNYVTFKKGILFANGENSIVGKGLALKTFLEKVAFKPKKVVFIDDKLENLQIVEAALKDDNTISFVGLHYVGAKHFPSQKVDVETFEKKYKEIVEKTKRSIK